MGADLDWEVEVKDADGNWQLVELRYLGSVPLAMVDRCYHVWADLIGESVRSAEPSAVALTVSRSRPALCPTSALAFDTDVAPIAVLLADLQSAGWPKDSPIWSICRWLSTFGEPNAVRLLLAQS